MEVGYLSEAEHRQNPKSFNHLIKRLTLFNSVSIGIGT